ncbi:MAG: hypothetical protein R3C99_07790 [Pirellulaceae bacterium]
MSAESVSLVICSIAEHHANWAKPRIADGLNSRVLLVIWSPSVVASRHFISSRVFVDLAVNFKRFYVDLCVVGTAEASGRGKLVAKAGFCGVLKERASVLYK